MGDYLHKRLFYYIRNKSSYDGNDVFWLKDNLEDGSFDLKQAGLYTQEEAEKILELSPNTYEAYTAHHIQNLFNSMYLCLR